MLVIAYQMHQWMGTATKPTVSPTFNRAIAPSNPDNPSYCSEID
ncbi:MAG: hypothetical protein WBA76_08600 [Phormidesmis sp.]